MRGLGFLVARRQPGNPLGWLFLAEAILLLAGKDAVDLDSVRDDRAPTVHQALEPAHLSVWISRHS